MKRERQPAVGWALIEIRSINRPFKMEIPGAPLVLLRLPMPRRVAQISWRGPAESWIREEKHDHRKCFSRFLYSRCVSFCDSDSR